LAQSERLVNSKLASADEVISRLEEKLSHFYVTGPLSTPNPRDSEWESSVAETLREIKSNMANGGGNSLNKEFFQSLTNDTLEAIEDMKLEVLTASDKSEASKIKFWEHKFHEFLPRFLKNRNPHQGNQRPAGRFNQ
jgi:hypothetical protein